MYLFIGLLQLNAKNKKPGHPSLEPKVEICTLNPRPLRQGRPGFTLKDLGVLGFSGLGFRV